MAPLIETEFGPDGFGTRKLVPVGTNRQPAAAGYLGRRGKSEYVAFKLDVLRVKDGQLAESTVFDASMFGEPGLPEAWSEDLSRTRFAQHGMRRRA